jgi:hypothetical protein
VQAAMEYLAAHYSSQHAKPARVAA